MDTMYSPRTRMLLSLNRFHCLTIAQAGKLAGYTVGTKSGSYTTVSMRLTELFQEGLIDYGVLPHEHATGGGGTKLYVLTADGREELRRIGVPITSDRSPFDEQRLVGRMEARAKKAKPDEKPKKARKLPEYWRHVMHSNEFLITAHLWRKQHRDYEFRRMLTEVDIHREKSTFPVKITVNDRITGVSPDGVLEVVLPTGKGRRFWVELEHDTYTEAQFKEKVRALTTFAQGTNITVFGSRILTIVFLATQGEEHRKRLLKLIAITLREMGESDTGIFRVTSTPVDDVRLFTDSVWYIPDNYIPEQLL